MTGRHPLPISEAAFQSQVVALAHLHGWRIAHFRSSTNRRGVFSTAVAADGAGWPDLTLVRERVVFVELKTATGRLSVAQAHWITDLRNAGAEAYVWRPSDFDEIARILAARSEDPA